MKISWKKVLYYLVIIFAFVIGIVVGMLIGTYALIDHVAYGLAGSTFIVNVNETKLMEEFNKTIYPRILNDVNQTARINK